jgi:hypothetical protein
MQQMPERKLLDQVSDVVRLTHLNLRTEETYPSWIRRFILFQKKSHPRQVDAETIRSFLTHLAVKDRVAAWNDGGVRMETGFGRCLLRASREKNKLDVDPGVAHETRLPQATISHAFSVKMRTRASAVPVLSGRAPETKTDIEATAWKVYPTHSSTLQLHPGVRRAGQGRGRQRCRRRFPPATRSQSSAARSRWSATSYASPRRALRV